MKTIKKEKIFMVLMGVFIGLLVAIIPKANIKADNSDFYVVDKKRDANIVLVSDNKIQSYVGNVVSNTISGQTLVKKEVQGGVKSFIVRPASIDEKGNMREYNQVSGTDFVNDTLCYKIISTPNNTYVLELSSTNAYFYFNDYDVMNNSSGRYGTWDVNITSKDGNVVEISRRATSRIKGFTLIDFCVSTINPNIARNMGNTSSAFDGTHDADDLYNSGGMGMYLDSNPVIGRRLSDNRDSIYDKIRENIKRFNRLIKIITMWIYGIAILLSMIALIMTVLKLVTSNSHPLRRYEAIMNILTCFICIALLGSITLITRLILQLSIAI